MFKEDDSVFMAFGAFLDLGEIGVLKLFGFFACFCKASVRGETGVYNLVSLSKRM